MNDTNRRGYAARGYGGYDAMRLPPNGITPLPANPVLAMAYVPVQVRLDVYPCSKALAAGTLFPELDKPFCGGCCK